MDVDREARDMLTECVAVGQSARRLDDRDTAPALRHRLRSLARARGLQVRTALMDDVVVIARTDAALWRDNAVTMRRKLTPPG